MTDQGEGSGPRYLTTKEVAELLRVKERKVYDLAAANEIPHRRITGKLLFPREEIIGWIEGSGTPHGPRPMVLAGSHDPLLEWAVHEAGEGLAMLLGGSLDGLERFAAGEAALAGMHLPEAGGWNLGTVAARGLRDCVLIGFARRARGLLLPKGRAGIASVADLRGLRVALRQPESGTAAYLAALLAEAGMGAEEISGAGGYARTESDAATAVAEGMADAALGIAAMAQRFHLDFVPLVEERFDLLIDRRAYFTPAVQALVEFTRSGAFAAKAAALGGYDIAECGRVRWISD